MRARRQGYSVENSTQANLRGQIRRLPLQLIKVFPINLRICEFSFSSHDLSSKDKEEDDLDRGSSSSSGPSSNSSKGEDETSYRVWEQ